MSSMLNKLHDELAAYPPAIVEAASRVAPAWPLDKSIAVNPWWHWRERPFSDVAARLSALGSVSCLMPRAYYWSKWQSQIKEEHLENAAKALGYAHEIEDLLDEVRDDASAFDSTLSHWHNMSELLDAQPARQSKMLWRDEIVQQISQFCGLYFRYPEHMHEAVNDESDLYRAWLNVTRQDRGIEVLMAEAGLHDLLKGLPDCPKHLCREVFEAFGSQESFVDYAHALLLEVNGWASWLAYTAWDSVAQNKTNNLVEQLLAIRLAWDWVLWQHCSSFDSYAPLRRRFLSQFDSISNIYEQHSRQQVPLWVWQRALELSYQQPLHARFKQVWAKSDEIDAASSSRPRLQAAFCIDVRSEPMRRALEEQDAGIQTLGFAGFFGLPIEYVTASGSYRRPQLPGLLSPMIQAQAKVESEQTLSKKRSKLLRSDLHHQAFNHPAASFGMVEMLGIFKAGKLVQKTLWPQQSKHSVNHLCGDEDFVLMREGKALGDEELAQIAASVLTHMGLRNHFAPTVLLLGHGSASANNPHAAGLDCGACGGQTGEINVKVLAQILNDAAVRAQLRSHDIAIPEETRFVAGLHNTTTDEIVCYTDSLDSGIQHYLEQASHQARSARAITLDLPGEGSIAQRIDKQTKDWSMLRPEWGLANNASFIVAPRALTKDLDLQGRSFLHDYDWRQDQGFKTLELIMTAPMIVTNWINLQYYASTVDNRVYGSGNKMLHNVVAEHIGVFEGNGGDLRIGLSKQSLHDGGKWRHTPQRLSVYIAAPREAIERVIAEHKAVEDLVNNKWLYLFHLDESSGQVARYDADYDSGTSGYSQSSVSGEWEESRRKALRKRAATWRPDDGAGL